MNQEQPEIRQTEEASAGANQLSDRDLVAEVLRKDRKATAEFVARYADHVYSYVRRRLIPRADLVEDLVQEVFLAAWENLEKFRGESALRTWLLGIARHKVEDHYRKRLREHQLMLCRTPVQPTPITPLLTRLHGTTGWPTFLRLRGCPTKLPERPDSGEAKPRSLPRG